MQTIRHSDSSAAGAPDNDRAAEFARRPILHVDMDAFYAAIEQHDKPSLRGRPVIVGAPPDRRGVVSAASYEARRYGVRSAMPSRAAARLCPHAVFLPVRMVRYREVSQQIMGIFREFTPLVEQISIDEAFLDVRGVARHWPSPEAVARAVKQRIREKTELTASVGVAPNKFLAKLASDLDKPDGLTVTPWREDEIAEFLAPLPVSRLWGVGPRTAEALERMGLSTIGDIQRADPVLLARRLGPAAADHLLCIAFGRDDRPVVTEHEEKSISHEITFLEDVSDRDHVRDVLVELTERVGARLRRTGRRARVIRVKVRFSNFRTITRSRTLPRPTDVDHDLIHSALELFEHVPESQPVRLIGFGVQDLTPSGESLQQPSLFPDSQAGGAEAERYRRLDRAVDELRERFGDSAVRWGLRKSQKSPPPE